MSVLDSIIAGVREDLAKRRKTLNEINDEMATAAPAKFAYVAAQLMRSIKGWIGAERVAAWAIESSRAMVSAGLLVLASSVIPARR
mgnify:CR=1 FL=1